MMHKLKGKRVTIFGMGKSGLAAASLLSRLGSQVLVVDDEQKKIPLALPSSIRLKLGGWSESDLINANLIVLSPGVPISKLPMKQLKASGIPVISEIELASSLITAPIIGITGTNGKSTTTTLVGQILHDWGLKVFVGGNLGLPLSESVSTTWDFVVAELSSFQLETITDFRPRIAALLNISPDHLDRYSDLSSYQQAKWRIFENQLPEDHAILNLDDPLTPPPSIEGSAVYFSQNRPIERGVFLENGIIKSTIWGDKEEICRIDALKTGPAVHIENILAATAIAQLCGCAIEGITRTLLVFKGLPHRMEFVRSVHGVQYLNDSKGTNIGALTRSLEDLNPPIILIAGGKDKASDFSPLRQMMDKKVVRLILLGEAKEKMAKCFMNHRAIETAQSMEDAVNRAAKKAQAGDTVLLSPGCASFDMFRDYEDRGETFKALVQALS